MSLYNYGTALQRRTKPEDSMKIPSLDIFNRLPVQELGPRIGSVLVQNTFDVYPDMVFEGPAGRYFSGSYFNLDGGALTPGDEERGRKGPSDEGPTVIEPNIHIGGKSIMYRLYSTYLWGQQVKVGTFQDSSPSWTDRFVSAFQHSDRYIPRKQPVLGKCHVNQHVEVKVQVRQLFLLYGPHPFLPPWFPPENVTPPRDRLYPVCRSK